MIEPFVEAQKRDGVISYGLSSYGYDARIADEFKIFTNIDSAVVDPKAFAPTSFVDRKTDICIIPPNSFALGHTIEYFRIPRDVLVICLGKSTYARCGIIVNVTPAGARMGRPGDDRNQQHHAAAGEDPCPRGDLPVPVPAGQRAVRDQLRRQSRQIHGPARHRPATDVRTQNGQNSYSRRPAAFGRDHGRRARRTPRCR